MEHFYNYFPELIAISFDTYTHNMSSTVYMTRQFKPQGTFIIAMNNSIVAVMTKPTTVSNYALIFFKFAFNKCHYQNQILI